MNSFLMNEILWKIKFINPDNIMLMDRTGTYSLATTDPDTLTIYISNILYGKKLQKVLIHELAHCAMFSFNLIPEIHKMVKPEYYIEAEEWVCNFISDYGLKVFNIMYSILKENTIYYIPYEIEKFIA